MKSSRSLSFRPMLVVVGVVWFGISQTLRADTAPEITGQPVSQTAVEGDTVTFSVTASGGNLSYQWRHTTTNLPGATDNPLVLTNVTFDHAGSYSVIVSNSVSTAASDKAVLTVVARAVWAWGDNAYDKATPPTGPSNVVAVAGGGDFSLALQEDGTVRAWGNDGYYHHLLGDGMVGVSHVAAGSGHSMALTTNGTVAAWGGFDLGETWLHGDWSHLVSVAAGRLFSLGLRADGTVALGGDPGRGMPNIPTDFKNVTAIAAGSVHTLTLRGDGTLVAWGSRTNVPAGMSNVVAVACGDLHSLALRADGTIVAWGDNVSGQIDVPAGLDNVVAIACGGAHSLALRADGTVVTWGRNNYGQTNVPSYVLAAGGIGAGCAATHSLAFPAQGPPFITTRLADQVWTQVPQTVFFRVEATGARPLHYQWQRNGVDLAGETRAVLQIADVLNRQGRYSVAVSNALGVATIPPARLLVTIPQTPMQAALENYLPWTNGGNSAWFVQTGQTVDGVDAAQSGAITHNQASWLETSVVGPGFLAYWWKVSSEADYDFLEFHLDGALQPGRISGSTTWQQRIVPIPDGPHTLRWRYTKDPADGAGLDAGFLDQVTFSNTLPTVAMLPNGSFQLCWTNVPGTPFSVVSTTNVTVPLNEWVLLSSPAEISPGQYVFTDAQATNHPQRFYRVRSP